MTNTRTSFRNTMTQERAERIAQSMQKNNLGWCTLQDGTFIDRAFLIEHYNVTFCDDCIYQQREYGAYRCAQHYNDQEDNARAIAQN